jgi:hypothetical protein
MHRKLQVGCRDDIEFARVTRIGVFRMQHYAFLCRQPIRASFYRPIPSRDRSSGLLSTLSCQLRAGATGPFCRALSRSRGWP